MDKMRNRFGRTHFRRSRDVDTKTRSLPFRRIYKQRSFPPTGREHCTHRSHNHGSQRREHVQHPFTPHNRQQSILPYIESQPNIMTHVLNMIVTDLQPLSLVEEEGFQRFVKALHPHSDISLSASLIRAELLHMYEQMRLKVQQEVSHAKDLVLSAEVWSSSKEASYLTVTCHFINKNWELTSYMLETAHLLGEHTPDNVHQQLLRISTEWEIMEKVQVVVINKEGMKKANPAVKWTYMPCFGHTLNKVVREAMDHPDWIGLLRKCRRIVAFFHQNSAAPRNVQLTQSPGVDWLPMLSMLDNISNQWPSISSVFMAKQMENIWLNEREREMLNRAVSALKVIRETVGEMGESGYSSASNIIPLCDALRSSLAQAQNNVAQRLAERCDHHIGSIRQNLWFTISTALDPRFKSSVLKNSDEKAVKAQIKGQMLKLARGAASRGYSRGGHGGEMNSEDFILQMYSKEKDMSRSQNPLQFWATREEFKQLAEVAHKYLTVVSTAVPVERITQQEKSQLFLNRRNGLELENVSMMLFLNSNREKIIKTEEKETLGLEKHQVSFTNPFQY